MPDENETNKFDFDSAEPWCVRGVRVSKKEYLLREPSAGDGHKYRSSRMKGGRLVDDGKTVVLGDPGESEILLVSLCLREVLPDGKEKSVEQGTVRGWPDRVTSSLFQEIKDRSPWLDGVKREDDRPKPSPGETGADSSDSPSGTGGP